jgi:peptidoglycan L-alanyl-D-glutamate endopeptidase CwlK
MASRDRKDLNSTLVKVFDKAESDFKKENPTFSQPFLTCTHRSNQEQEALYAQGRSTPGSIVTWAQPGQSPHNFSPSFAFDIAFIGVNKQLDWSPSLFKLFDKYVQQAAKELSVSVVWGGSWATKPDAPHWELKNWKTFNTLA